MKQLLRKPPPHLPLPGAAIFAACSGVLKRTGAEPRKIPAEQGWIGNPAAGCHVPGSVAMFWPIQRTATG